MTYGRLAILVAALAAGWSARARAQQASIDHRENSWELSLGGGMTLPDGSLRGFLGSGAPEYRFANSVSPGSGTATVVAGVSYYFSHYVGFRLGGSLASGSGVTYLTPSASVILTTNVDARTSPYAVLGTEFTRLTGGNGRVTHSTWGLQTGLGVRHMLGPNLALRGEGLLQIEGYHEVPMSKSTVVNPAIVFGLSYFVGSRSAPR